MNPLIHHWFGARSHKRVKSLFALQHKAGAASDEKDFAGEVLATYYLVGQGGVRPVSKGVPNGLEDTEDRRSAGGYGNQHVCVRRPQVSGCDSFIIDLRWIARCDTFPIRDGVYACVHL
jgi:hypothetical protein